MSKEKQCECCHEWWYDSDVKEDLCPNCYDYFKQLKQQLAEKDKEIERLIANESEALKYYSSTRTVYIRENRCKRCGKEISSILPDMFEGLCYECFEKFERGKFVPEQQLDEKDKLLKCYQEEEKLIADILGDKDLTIIGSRVHLKNLIVELKNKIKDKDIVIEEKDKEIERLKNLFKLNNEVVINQGKEMFDLRVQVLQQKQNQTQLAIQELEKVKDTLKHFYNIHSDEYYGVKTEVKGIELDVCESIDYQIKELKGEQT